MTETTWIVVTENEQAYRGLEDGEIEAIIIEEALAAMEEAEGLEWWELMTSPPRLLPGRGQ